MSMSRGAIQDPRWHRPWFRCPDGRCVTPVDGEALRLGPGASHGVQYVQDDLGRINPLRKAVFEAQRERVPTADLARVLRPLSPAVAASRFPAVVSAGQASGHRAEPTRPRKPRHKAEVVGRSARARG